MLLNSTSDSDTANALSFNVSVQHQMRTKSISATNVFTTGKKVCRTVVNEVKADIVQGSCTLLVSL